MSTRKLTKALKTQKSKTQQTIVEIYGTLGIPLNGQKLVDVPERSNYVYVRLRDNQNEVVQAFNNTVATSYDLPVIVNREGNRYTVMGLNTARYQNTWNVVAPYLPNHGNSHSFSDSGGGDVSWIFSRQFMPNLVYPSSVFSGTNLQVAGYNLYNQGVWKYVGNTGTPSPLPYLPTGSTIMALLYMDAFTGNPGWIVGSGSYFPSLITGSADVIPYIPAPTDTSRQIPLAGVRLTPMSTGSISWDNIYDVRQWLHTTPSGTSSGGGGGVDTIGFVGQNKGVYLATGTVLNVNGTRLIMSVSGTVFNLTNSPDPYDSIGMYGVSGTTGIATGTSLVVRNYLGLSSTGTFLYLNPSIGTGTFQLASGDRGVTNGDSHDHLGGDGGTIAYSSLSGTPTAETNTNDIFFVASPGGPSLWTGTISGAPSGASVTVSAPATGTEEVLVPVSTSQLAKMRLYNLTRGDSALISNYNTGTNVITLTANAPAAWANGDSLTVTSQTVSGGGLNWIDLEITSGLTGKSNLFVKTVISSATVGDAMRIHPFDAVHSSSKYDASLALVSTRNSNGFALIKVTNNVFSLSWTGTPTNIVIRESGYLG